MQTVEPSHPGIRFGIHSAQQGGTLTDYQYLWQKAEELGFDWASVMDHFLAVQTDPNEPCLEGMTLLAAMAARTSRIRCGVLAVGVTYRNPALLAKIATTIDHISGGRLELCLGAAWYELEHRQMGIPFPRVGERIAMLAEAAAILKQLWTQERTTYHGRYYTIEDAVHAPKPVQQPHPPLWIGGVGERKTLRVVAESADGWNCYFMPLPAYLHKLDMLEQHCRAVGRDPSTIRKAVVFQPMVGESQAEVDTRAARLAADFGADVAAIRPRSVIGSPEECVEQLLPYVKLGVTDFIADVRPPADVRCLELIAGKVAPLLRREALRQSSGL